MSSLDGEDEAGDRFPVGMRVLAVDDDQACLKLLDALLRKCQYHVTTTNEAAMALKLLRENKDKFDLVISDVQMPDMDGFKLLELVGLEMDLPVIMLSAYGDTKFVMKGITHGACDYLLKPVRIEELKNIWQHVIRRKKFDSKGQTKSLNQEKETGEGEQGPQSTCNSDQNEKTNRKRKDQSEVEDEEGEENPQENDDPSSQKKPRVVWSVDLHRKFVAAVNQLGIDKAFPKRILEIMNVEGLTRENVASHLQKYRLYLKRISSAASQQANMVAALGAKDSPYTRLNSLDGVGDFCTLTGSGRLSNIAPLSYPAGGMLGRFNTAAGLSLRELTPGLIPPGHVQNTGHTMRSLGKFQPVVPPANPNASIFSGIPTSLEFDQLQQSKCTGHIGEFNQIDDPTVFTFSNGFPDTSTTVSISSNSQLSPPSNLFSLQRDHQKILNGGEFVNQSCLKVASLNQEPCEVGVSGSSNFLDHNRINQNWQSAVQPSNFPSDPLQLSEPFNHDQLPLNNLQDNISSSRPRIMNSSIDLTSTDGLSSSLEDSSGEMQYQTGLLGNVVQNVNHVTRQRSDHSRQDYANNSSHSLSTMNSLFPVTGVVSSLNQSLDGQLNGGAPSSLHQGEVEKSAMDTKMRMNEDYVLEQLKSQGGLVQNSWELLDDLMAAIVKREQGETIF